MNQFEQCILEIISTSSGIRAKDIAQKLNCDRKDVNTILHTSLKNRCRQDSYYRWHLKEHEASGTTIIPSTPPDKVLSDLCHYYLDCLNLDQNSDMSFSITSTGDNVSYLEISNLSVNDVRAAGFDRKLLANRKALHAYIGYPVLIDSIYNTKTQRYDTKAFPVFIFTVEPNGGSLAISSIPHINPAVIKRCSASDDQGKIYDLIALERELGLGDSNTDVEPDEMVSRLQAIRPQWPWQEVIDPSTIHSSPPADSCRCPGIYNRAFFVITEREHFTASLASELNELSRLKEEDYRGTALYSWLHPEATDSLIGDDKPLLEVLPMNTEQRQAVHHALCDHLTVVTGPPGTGKSQVVANLLINAVWFKKTVLFTSQNNKAVDVVEKRVNALGRLPVVLRMGGSNGVNLRLAELISDLLSYVPDKNGQDTLKQYQKLYQEKLTAYQALKAKKDDFFRLRNHTDHLEQQICTLRERWSKWFDRIQDSDASHCNAALQRYLAAYDSRQRTLHSFWGRLLWFFVGWRKNAVLNESLTALNAWFHTYEWPVVVHTVEELDDVSHVKLCEAAQELANVLSTIGRYRSSMRDLLAATPPEDLDRELGRVQADLSTLAGKLWNTWLATQSPQMNAASRQKMNSYIAAARLFSNVDHKDSSLSSKSLCIQKEMAKLFPCRAITSLSLHGRVPFQPGLFDLVVIDEASQCSIASALPALYRAKRAVIIGDPKQLSHISSISNSQDLHLLFKHNVDMGWSYTATSLFALANSLVMPEHAIHLRDHHRSCADIIEFSNAEFYDGRLRVATNYDQLNCPPHMAAGIRWIDVIGKTRRLSTGSAYNDIEAKAVIAQVKHMVLECEYKGSIGIVTPLRAQADRIRRAIQDDFLLYNKLTSQNDFGVDTIHGFQGDERDVMFFSPVISQGIDQPDLRGTLRFLQETGNLFNVAVTRARAVLIAVGDMDCCSKCGVPYLEHFVKYVRSLHTNSKSAEMPTYPEGRLYPKVPNPEQVSDWERLFYTALFDRGIRTIPQYSEDKYKLDLAIVRDGRKLDIEVDGELYHKDWNGELCYRDQLRNQRLFELGWDIKRFWVYQIRDDLQGCIDQIQQWLNHP